MLDRVSGGRAYLGLARGAWLDRIGIEAQRPVQTLREAILLVRHLLARRQEAFDGQVFKLAAGAMLNYAPLRDSVPIMIGTWGRQTATMAGQLVDEVKVGGSTNPFGESSRAGDTRRRVGRRARGRISRAVFRRSDRAGRGPRGGARPGPA